MLALSRIEEEIWICDTKTDQRSYFDGKTGVKLRGDLDLPAEEVLYRAWAQTQSEHNERVLRKRFSEIRAMETS